MSCAFAASCNLNFSDRCGIAKSECHFTHRNQAALSLSLSLPVASTHTTGYQLKQTAELDSQPGLSAVQWYSTLHARQEKEPFVCTSLDKTYSISALQCTYSDKKKTRSVFSIKHVMAFCLPASRSRSNSKAYDCQK